MADDDTPAARAVRRLMNEDAPVGPPASAPTPDDVPVDPTGIPEPHDVLAAEEFGIGAADADTPEARAHRELPEDPSNVTEQPHDILAAEEFPLPSPAAAHAPAPGAGRSPAPRVALALVLGVAVAVLVRRLRS